MAAILFEQYPTTLVDEVVAFARQRKVEYPTNPQQHPLYTKEKYWSSIDGIANTLQRPTTDAY